ncbi:MAG: thiamine pyrophosphate-dependent dehydrogenase E1 component subunit alpha [Candidatus Brocadiae bacterium]|nr:thiamine pyrophosphate-dependent dehydrogenase E1 component subunit alpha [Candidatus Brocadiia bacterium]
MPVTKMAKAPAAAGTPGMLQVLDGQGRANPEVDPQLPAEELRALYRAMLQLRIFDTRMLSLQRSGRIGFYGTATGQEAATIGSAWPLKPQDWIFPALREGGTLGARGYPLRLMVAQLIGNAIDVCKGRQMPCHYSDPERHYVSMSSVIATQFPHAVGAAMAAKYRKDPVVVMGYIGDGGTSASDFHVAMNFAGVYRPPVVLVCQNNHWAISVPSCAQTASETIAQKAVAYGFEGLRVDGNDVLAVVRASRAAIEKARAGGGPTFLELFTYRRLGHSSSDDPTRYRDPAEVAAWEAKDPIERFRRHLESRALWTQAWQTELETAINDEISAGVREGEAAGPPPIESLFDDVFQTPTAQLEEQRRYLMEQDEARKGDGAFPL